jgi:hypothetical protein
MSKKANNKKHVKTARTYDEEWIKRMMLTEPLMDVTAPTEDDSLKYDQRLVAFLDLLGITQKIRETAKNKEESEIISTMSKIKNIVESEINTAPMPIDMLYISDSFIFVCRKEVLGYFLKMLSCIQTHILIECKILLRGALEYGDVVVRDEGKQIIGPAYIDAYLRQEKDAIYPRIIMGNSVLKLLLNQPYEKIISQDQEASLDYIGAYMESEKKNKNDMIIRLRREGVFDHLCDEYKKYDNENELSIRAKYAWTINYLIKKGVWSDEKHHNCWQKFA